MHLDFIRKNLSELCSPRKISILVLKDILKIFWHRYMIIGLFSALAFLLQVLGISIILGLFNESFHLPFSLHETLLYALSDYHLVILASALLSLSTILLFTARKLTVNMMLEYESICANQLFALISQGFPGYYRDSEVMRLLSKDCRFGGRIVQEIGNVAMPAGVSIIAFPLLFYLNFQLTLIILVVIAVTLLPYGLIASKANMISSEFERSSGKDSQYKKKAIEFSKQGNTHPGFFFPHHDFRKYYRYRLLFPHYGLLIGGLQLALCFGAFGLWLILSEDPVPEMASILLYGFIVVFTLSQLKSATKVFASFHVFLAYFKRAFVIIKDIQDVTPQTHPDMHTDDNQETLVNEDF